MENYLTNISCSFLPYIGSHYSSGGMFRRRVMVLGDSHYGDVPRAEITREVMRWYLDPDTEREGWMNTFVKFERSLVGHETDWAERRAIWDSVMFYNYLQVLLSGPREAGTPEQYRDSAGAFYQVMEQHRPEVLIVWGKRLWDKLPGEGWEDGSRVEVEGYEVPNGYYNLKNGHRVRAFCVYHPSVGYDWGYWHRVVREISKLGN